MTIDWYEQKKPEIKTVISEQPYLGWRLFYSTVEPITENSTLQIQRIKSLTRQDNTWDNPIAMAVCHNLHIPKQYASKEDMANHMTRCSCGIYSFNSVNNKQLLNSLLGDAYILGEIYLWGAIVKHRDGYRSQYAKVKRLYVSEFKLPLCAELTSKYNIGLIRRNKRFAQIVRGQLKYITDDINILNPSRVRHMKSGLELPIRSIKVDNYENELEVTIII